MNNGLNEVVSRTDMYIYMDWVMDCFKGIAAETNNGGRHLVCPQGEGS